MSSLASGVPVPVTLVTGFLGAGKTTLVNNMLRDADGLRLAVLVNDFGAINIDAELIDGAAEDIVALKNGCICCSITGGLLAAVSGVLCRPKPPDAIIIEASGVSDPLEIARALSDPDLQHYAPLDGIVTVVDAAGMDELDGEALELTQRQILSADIILLNKVDQADSARLADMEARLAGQLPKASLIRCMNADVPLHLLLGLAGGGFGMGDKANHSSEIALNANDAFESIVIEQSGPIAIERLHHLLSRLPERVYRVKGFVQLAERPEVRCILQATGRRAAITIDQPWKGETPGSRIVFIAAKGTCDALFIKNVRSVFDGIGTVYPA